MQWAYDNVQYYLFCVSDIILEGMEERVREFCSEAPPSFSSYISRVQRWVSILDFTLFSYVSRTQIFSSVIYIGLIAHFPLPPWFCLLLFVVFDQANHYIQIIPYLSPSLLLDPEMKWPSSVALHARLQVIVLKQ